MKDFDAEWAGRDSEENRRFKVRGEEFVRRVTVRPEVLFPTDDADAVRDDAGAYARVDAQILAMIEDTDDGHARYRALREREHETLGYRDIRDLKEWLLYEFTGLPTFAPSSSGNGRGSSGTGSTARSSSRVAAG